MLRVKCRLTLVVGSVLAIAPAGVARAQGVKDERPAATVAEAARVIDLETFPMMADGKVSGPRRLASLRYRARGEARAAYAFQKTTLETRGWKEMPGGYLSDQSCSGAFAKDGYTVSVSTVPATGPDGAGLVDVALKNHGNVDAGTLPVPAGAKRMYAFPTTTAYVTDKPVKETSEAVARLLTAKGWEPYGAAGDSRFFKKNAVRLSTFTVAAPAQGGKTVLQLATELLSADLPAPPALLDASYSDTTKALSVDVAMTPEALAAFYREALGKAGWKPTTDKPVKIDFRRMWVFRNDAEEVAILTMHEVQGKLRANLEHRTAAEFAEAARLADAEDAKRKAEAKRYREMAAEAAAKDRITVAIAVPAGAKGVERSKDRLEFKLAAGTARGAVEAIRAELLKDGWKGRAKVLEPMAGTISLGKKPGGIVTIVYIDTGRVDAEVTITTIGAEIEGAGAK